MNPKYRVNTIEYFVERIDETFYLRELTATQLAKISKSYESGKVDQIKIMSDMLYMSLVDSEGKALLTKKDISEMGGSLFMELATKAGELNHMSAE